MRFVHAGLWLLLMMVGILTIWTLGPIVETKYWPVYSKFRVLSVKQTNEGLEFMVRFTKYRNCDPQGYAWFVGDFNTGAHQIPARGIGPVGTVHRPLGTQNAGPFLLRNLTYEDIPNLYAEIYHHCHPLWITRSVIYP